jgi:DNA repair exonuclease SbcCD ATPase subunit
MKLSAITLLCWFGLAATVAAQGTSNGKAASGSASSKLALSEVRSLLHELQARNEKLDELMTQYRSLLEERPQSEGGSPEAKQAHAQQLAKWNGALERLLHRIDEALARVVETEHRLDPSATGPLPTGLAKEVVNAHNEAEAQRAAAEHARAKNKPAPARSSKPAKQAPAAKPAPPIPDDL